MFSHPELGSDPPIGSDRDPGVTLLFYSTSFINGFVIISCDFLF